MLTCHFLSWQKSNFGFLKCFLSLARRVCGRRYIHIYSLWPVVAFPKWRILSWTETKAVTNGDMRVVSSFYIYSCITNNNFNQLSLDSDHFAVVGWPIISLLNHSLINSQRRSSLPTCLDFRLSTLLSPNRQISSNLCKLPWYNLRIVLPHYPTLALILHFIP